MLLIWDHCLSKMTHCVQHAVKQKRFESRESFAAAAAAAAAAVVVVVVVVIIFVVIVVGTYRSGKLREFA